VASEAFKFLKLYLYIYILAVLGLYCCVGFSVVAANGGYSPVAVHRLLFIVASLVVEHRF
jgi:hypothetical protein